MAMGAAVEIAEGLSGAHHCKTIDLIPDFIGASLGVMIVLLGGMIARMLFNDGRPRVMQSGH
jgi:hypothetical protein